MKREKKTEDATKKATRRVSKKEALAIQAEDRIIKLLEQELARFQEELAPYDFDPTSIISIIEEFDKLLPNEPPPSLDDDDNDEEKNTSSEKDASPSDNRSDENNKDGEEKENRKKNKKNNTIFDGEEDVVEDATNLFQKIKNSSIQIEEREIEADEENKESARRSILVCSFDDIKMIISEYLKNRTVCYMNDVLKKFYEEGLSLQDQFLKRDYMFSSYSRLCEKNLYRVYTDKKTFEKVVFVPRREVLVCISIDHSSSMNHIVPLDENQAKIAEKASITRYDLALCYVSFMRGLFNEYVKIVMDLRMTPSLGDIAICRKQINTYQDIFEAVQYAPDGNTPEAILFPKKQQFDYFVYISDGMPDYGIDPRYRKLYNVGSKGNYSVLVGMSGETAEKYFETYCSEYEITTTKFEDLPEISKSIFQKEFTV